MRLAAVLAACLATLLFACTGTEPTTGTCGDLEVTDACSAAVDQINICCAGTLHDGRTGDQLCADQADAGLTPGPSCRALAQASCASLHDTLLGQDTCCCPAGQACDPSAGGACAPTCRTASDCPTRERPDCSPPTDLSGPRPVIVAGPLLCQLDDGRAAHGCSGLLTFCGDNLYCAHSPSADAFCSPACTTDAECGNPGVACCSATSLGSPTGKACGPC